MEKLHRNERISTMMKILADNPNRIMTLSSFCDLFGTAKSTMSEDVDILQKTVRRFDLGEVGTVTGASGGVWFRPVISKEKKLAFLNDLCEKLSGTERVLPGGFLYYSDILSAPDIVKTMGEIIAGEFYDKAPDFVLTMETKGIPVAYATATAMSVPLVIARHSSKVYEGSAVNINYVSGSGNIETMSLSRRAVREGQKALIVDDFLKGGGTAKGMEDLMREFRVEVVGSAFVMATVNPAKKRIEGEKSLMTLEIVGDDRDTALVTPSDWLR